MAGEEPLAASGSPSRRKLVETSHVRCDVPSRCAAQGALIAGSRHAMRSR